MLIRALEPFRDFECGVDRSPGDEWEVSPERFAEIDACRDWGRLASPVDVGGLGRDELLELAGALGLKVQSKASTEQVARAVERKIERR